MATTSAVRHSLPGMVDQVYHTAVPQTGTDVLAFTCILAVTLAWLLRGIAWDKQDPYYHLYFERPQLKDGATSVTQQESRNIALRLEETKKNVVVFWGSQSGTAEALAGRLARELHLRFGLETMTADLSDYDAETIALIPDSKFAIFLLSTYGEGDPSDNAQLFWKWITEHQSSRLESLRYAAFGLGNSNYKFYNKVIDTVVAALDSKGGKAMLPVGKADDAQGATEEDYMRWKECLFATLRTVTGLEEKPLLYEPTLEVVKDDSLDLIDLHDGTPVHSSAPKALPVTRFDELFKASSRNCLHVELDLADIPEIRYKTGDHLAVWPMNPDQEVENLLSVLGLSDERATPIIIRSNDSSVKVKLPTPTTPAVLFRHYLEICAPPSRETIKGLAQFAPSPEARSLLMRISEDQASYASFTAKTLLTLGRLLMLASGGEKWSALPLSWVVESLSPMQPRYYSISSSSLLSPRKITITALVAKTPLHDAPEETILGVTTSYMLALARSKGSSLAQPSDTSLSTPTYQLLSQPDLGQSVSMYAHVRKSKFKLPITSSCPLIMIAAGTGIAPFRAFITERARLQAIGKPVGRMMLFFGCRSPEEDYIYQDELQNAQRQSLGDETLQIVTAFSRVKGRQKLYVQDRVEEHGKDVAEMVAEQGANVYICGRASMAREVGSRFGKVLASFTNMSDADADALLSGMRRNGKWQEDVWG
ncbi:hypothetical protein M8818_006045 [Zalaria obscura]|uniref:Uncharacterized protein n=1 Tax=Zalaria obscura TaxID=2024903 RepID=A0ACC3S6S2_9PEZI